MVMETLKRRIQELERLQLSPRPRFSRQFDDDALAIYNSEAYLDATMEPSYHDIESTAIYARGEALRDKLYGPIIPAHLDEHIKVTRGRAGNSSWPLVGSREKATCCVMNTWH